MASTSRANVPKYNLETMLQQVQGQVCSGSRLSNRDHGLWHPRSAHPSGDDGIFSSRSAEPLASRPPPPPQAADAATASPPPAAGRRRRHSLEPAPGAEGEGEEEEETASPLKEWITVFGLDWGHVGGVRSALTERFGTVVDCKVPRKGRSAAHYRFDSEHSALMAVQDSSFTMGNTTAYTAKCRDESVLQPDSTSFLNLDSKHDPRNVEVHVPPYMSTGGTLSLFREAVPLFVYVIKHYLRAIIIAGLLPYLFYVFRSYSSPAEVVEL